MNPLHNSLKHWLCVVAHYDDEALFMGGLLLRLAELGREIYIAVATDVTDTNRPPIKRKRRKYHVPFPEQCVNRLCQFNQVCYRLHAHPIHLHQRQSESGPSRLPSLQKAIGHQLMELEPHAIVTHGAEGEYGHHQHKLVALAVATTRDPACPVFGCDLEGEISVGIDHEAKVDLLKCYYQGGHTVQFWTPYLPKSDYYNWAKENHERYTLS